MDNDKTWLLVKRLAAKTDAGQVAWEKTIEPGTYQATFSGYVLRLFTRDGNNGDDIFLRILDDFGAVVEEIVDTQFPRMDGGPNPYKVMLKMFHSARRQAVGADRAVNDLLQQLGEDDEEEHYDSGPQEDEDLNF